MGRGEMIGVRAIFELQLPIGVVGEGDASGDELDALLALIGDQIEQDRGLAKVLGQRRHLRRKAAEQEATMVPEVRKAGEIVAVCIEGSGVAAGLLPLDALVAAGAVEAPAVIGADVKPGIALTCLGDARALVWARI